LDRVALAGPDPVKRAKMSRCRPKSASHFDRHLNGLFLPIDMRIGALGQAPTIPRKKDAGGDLGYADRNAYRRSAWMSGGVMATAVSEMFGSHPSAMRAFQAEGAYRPSANEEFMGPLQLAYFRQKLLNWKESIVRESRDTMAQLKSGPMREADLTDRASSETDWAIELRTRDRQRKLISKIDAALRRIEQGEYGFCEVTGEPISLGRLEARPIATMTVEAQERHERQERVSRED
jgi:DnaK suppressor protein